MNTKKLNKRLNVFLEWLSDQADPTKIESLYPEYEARYINKYLDKAVEQLESALYYINS